MGSAAEPDRAGERVDNLRLRGAALDGQLTPGGTGGPAGCGMQPVV